MNTSPLSKALLLLVLASVLYSTAARADDQGFMRITPDAIEWKKVGNSGVEVAVLAGDPAKPGGIYVQRVKFPPGTFSSPHYHPQDRHVTVLKGTWYTGTGEAFDAAKSVPLKTGSYMMHPAKAVHWDGAMDEEVIVQIIGTGPAETIRVHPGEGPFISVRPSPARQP
jgi:quercetin dioxygenase-like cupin family protein